MIAIIDYGVGNLFSLKSSLAYVGAEACVTGDIEKIKSADKIILPGVGAFGDAVKKLKDACLDEVIVSEAKKGKPIMAFASVCRFCLTKVLNTANTRAWDLSKAKSAPYPTLSAKI